MENNMDSYSPVSQALMCQQITRVNADCDSLGLRGRDAEILSLYQTPQVPDNVETASPGTSL